MFSKKEPEHSFYGVSIFFIILGALIFTYGIVAWLFNNISLDSGFYFPSFKVIGGAIIMLLGYIQLELELLRQK